MKHQHDKHMKCLTFITDLLDNKEYEDEDGVQMLSCVTGHDEVQSSGLHSNRGKRVDTS